MTRSVCANACFVRGYKYGAVAYGQECYCSSSFNFMPITSANCTMPCTGDKTQMCGGFWCSWVFEVVRVKAGVLLVQFSPLAVHGTDAAHGHSE